jgi:NADH-quinone oxidoreductase subunit G
MLDEPRQVVVVYDCEPHLDCADGARWTEVLAQADTVIYAGAYANDAIREMADIILPLATLPEAEGSLTNVDGSTQVNAGTGHSPGESRSGWKVLRALGNTLGLDDFEFTRIAQVRETIQAGMAADHDEPSSPEPAGLTAPQAGPGLALYVEVPMYAVDGVVRRSAPLQDTVHAASSCVRVHPADAESLTGAESALVTAGESTAIIPVLVDPRVAPGCAVLAAGVAEVAGLIHASRVEVAPA